MNNNANKVSATERSYLIKKIAILGVLSALAYATTYLTSPIKFFEFLSCDIKDAIIVIASFIFDPISGLLVTVVVSLLETVTFSTTGYIGLIMNIISSACFAFPAAIIYRKKHTIKGAVIGLILGSIIMTIAMLLWNYIMTPIYMGVPRDVVTAMLPTVFLPFNLLKAGINSTLAIILYKKVVSTLRKANLIPKSTNEVYVQKRAKVSLIVISAVILIGCVLALLIIGGVI